MVKSAKQVSKGSVDDSAGGKCSSVKSGSPKGSASAKGSSAMMSAEYFRWVGVLHRSRSDCSVRGLELKLVLKEPASLSLGSARSLRTFLGGFFNSWKKSFLST